MSGGWLALHREPRRSSMNSRRGLTKHDATIIDAGLPIFLSVQVEPGEALRLNFPDRIFVA
jgi:hypothetical protein